VGTPRCSSRPSRVRTMRAESSNPSGHSPRSISNPMSYQPRMTMPLLIVIGRIGASGSTNRIGIPAGNSSMFGNDSKSWQSAPNPCRKMIEYTGSGPVSSSSTWGSLSAIVRILTARTRALYGQSTRLRYTCAEFSQTPLDTA